MDAVEDDVDAALTWKALQDADVAVAVAAVDGESHALGVAAVGREHHAVSGASVEHGDVADFVPLADLPPYPDAVDSALGESDGHAVDSEDADVTHAVAAPLAMAVATASASRFKRKNFSKHLQFLCLQRYADHAKTQGKLPDRDECQFLLHQSFAQFVREGGSADHPRLSYPEFLKLIRNRSRERQERLSRASAEDAQRVSKQAGSSSVVAQASGRGLARQSNEQIATKSRRRSSKRKWTEEVEKIDELIEVIDRARRRATAQGSGSLVDSAATRSRRRGVNTSSATTATYSSMQNSTASAAVMSVPLGVVVDPTVSSDIVDSILKMQQETLSLQHLIKERLESIQEQCRHQEPASASV